jgi:glucose-1-phosphate thymidylyltransferase
MKGIILHGGHGSRLRPLTHTGPKQLIPIASKPISQYVLEDLIEAGIEEIIIVLGDVFSEKVKEYYGDGGAFNVKLSYIHQGEPKGIAHAVALCEQYVSNEPFIVSLGDNLIKGGVKSFVETFKTSNYDAMVLLCKVENPQRFGVARFDEKGKLIGLVEKPEHPPSNYALTGIYLLKSIIFGMIRKLKPSRRGELEITEALQLLIEGGYSIGYQTVKGWWKDTGAPEDILEANRLVLDELTPEIKGEVEDKNSIQGRVSIGENSIVKRGALIRGPAIIGVNSTIEANVYIGPYTSIGNSTIINHGEIENSIIMDNCHIDIDDRITDSLIGPNSTITSNKNNKPRARRFLIGEQSQITL